MLTKPMSPRRLFEPEPKSSCLCGSGGRFKNCCASRLPGFDRGQQWRAAANDGRLLTAIKHLRADITQYTIWHLTNTAPAVAKKPELRSGRLMHIDILALSDQVSDLMWAYGRYGWMDKIPAVLDRLKTNIDDSRWLAKIAYHRAIHALWCRDRDRAIAEIAPLLPITVLSDDENLLQLYLDLHRRRIGLSENRAICARIIELSKIPSDKIHYAGAAAYELLLAGDDDGARKEFDAIIALARHWEQEEPLSLMAETWLCLCLQGRATLDYDVELFKEIDRRLSRYLFEGGAHSVETRAYLLRCLGDTRRYAGVYEGAAKVYRMSDELVPAPELRTFEAECELRLGNEDEAFRLIRSIAVNKLGEAERADHAFTYFYIALKRRDRPSLLDARELLKNAATPLAYFNTRRLEHIVTIGEALEALDKEQATPELGPILSGLKSASRYIQMQPNWAGVGINGNAIINDVVARAEEKAKRAARDLPTYDGDVTN